jgi:large subunit ribosomal protein L3
MSAIIGRKLGMTQIFREDGSVVPVTVVEAGPCPITAIRRAERDGYDALQLAYGETAGSKLTKPELGHLKKAGAPPMRHLVEFRDVALPVAGREETGKAEAPSGDDQDAAREAAAPRRKIGDTVSVADFEVGQKVKVSGTSVGKGFQGAIKRHRFSRGPETHGSHNVRAPGSIGASADPARVFKGLRMPGRMGGKRVTQRRLEIAEIDAERNLLLIKGSVPGARNAIVEVRTDG